MGFATSPSRTQWHRPTGAPDGCRFKLRNLTGAEKARIIGDNADLARMMSEGSQDVRIGTVCVDALKRALVGWEGFTDDDENEIDFAESTKLDRIPQEAILEMGLVAVGMAKINEGDLGNFASASPLSRGDSPTAEPVL